MNNTGRKYGGRVKGVPNKITSEIRAIISDIIHSEANNIPNYLEAITRPEMRLKMIIELLPYAIPKESSSIDVSLNNSDEITNEDLRVAWLEHLKK